MHTIPRIDRELKALIPPLTEEEREQLEQNILRKRKCHDAIVLWEGAILDGHNRFEICVKHGITFEIKEVQLESKDAAKLWIIENQMGRRNLNDAMRIEMTQRRADILRDVARKRQSSAGGDKTGEQEGISDEKSNAFPKTNPDGKGAGALLAKMTSIDDETINVRELHAQDANVSERTLHNYQKLKAQAHPGLLARVQSGEIKINTAHRMLTSEIIKKLDQADKMYKFVSRAIPPEGLKAANPELYEKLTQLAETLDRLVAALDERRKHANHKPIL